MHGVLSPFSFNRAPPFSSHDQVYTGVKCVRFRFSKAHDKEIAEGVLMGIGVLWLNAMVWALTQLVAEATREEGILEPSLHPHR